MNKNLLIGWLSAIVVALGVTCAYQHKVIGDQAAYIQWVTPVKTVVAK